MSSSRLSVISLGRAFQLASLVSGICVLTVIIFSINPREDLVAKMTMMIVIAEMLYAFPFAFIISGQFYCNVRNISSVYGIIAIGLWTICFTRHLKMTVHSHEIHPHAFKIYTFISQSIPILFCIPLYWLKLSVWDPVAEVCRPAVGPGKIDFPLLFIMIIPTLVMITMIIVALVYSIQSMRKMKEIRHSLQLSFADTYGILLYKPIVTVIIWVPMLVVEIMIFMGVDIGKHATYTYLHSVSYLQAVLTAIGFAFLSTVREKICCCCRRKKTAEAYPHLKSSTHSASDYSKMLEESFIRKSSVTMSVAI